MRISPVTTVTGYQNNKSNNRPNFNGAVDYREINRFITMLPNRIVKEHSATSEDMFKATSVIDKINNKMEKFSFDTVLRFRNKNEKEYEVFIEHPHSNYKEILPTFKLSERGSAVEDVEAFSKLADDIEKTNQFDVELKFCQMRHDNVPRSAFRPTL